jgi:hypothetical protein
MKGGVILFSAILAIAGLYTWERLTAEQQTPQESRPAPASTERLIEERANSDSSLRATAPARPRGRERPAADQSRPAPARTDEPAPPAPETAPHLELEVENLAWESRIDAVMGAAGLSNAAKAKQLLDLLPALPEEGLQRGAEMAMELLRDKDYALVRGRLLDPQTHGMIASVLFADLLERPDEIALPALLAIARIPSHPYAAAAYDNLELLLGDRMDPQSGQWEIEIKRALAAH